MERRKDQFVILVCSGKFVMGLNVLFMAVVLLSLTSPKCLAQTSKLRRILLQFLCSHIFHTMQ